MSLNYRKIMCFLAKGNKWQFDIPKQQQIDFINSLGNPIDDIDRSFKQYQSQMLFMGLRKRIIFNTISLFAFPLFLIVAYCRRVTTKKKNSIQAIIQQNTHSGIIPKSLLEKYQNLDQTPWAKGWSMGISDIKYITKLFRYIHRSPYFVLKNVYKGAIYSKMIKNYSPKVIVVFNEYSFTSSALTYLCERKGVEHIDVMHGEKLFYIRDSFFRFSHTYVWNEYYIGLFSKMKVPTSQFIVEVPPFMSINFSDYDKEIYHSDYTYYLANFNEEEIKNIVKSMELFTLQGKKVVYRPHPRYSDIELLRKYVGESSIEYPGITDIMISVANTDCAVGVYTTVLNQAFCSGRKVIIDNVNFPSIFNKLSELEYILLNKNLTLLSEEINHD